MAAAQAEQPVTFSLKNQSRALAAVHSDKFVSTWIVGTNSLREENEVRIMQYDADQERLVCSKALTHTQEVWDVAASPTATDLIITVWSQGGSYGATLWSTIGSSSVQKVADLPSLTGLVRRVLWHTLQPDLAVTVEEGALQAWTVTPTGIASAGSVQAGELLQLWSGQLHPTNAGHCATAGGNNVQLWDLRALRMVGEVVGAHRMPARDVCYSPTSEHRLLSAGDDCKLRVWDLRMLGKSEALLELGGHSHWVWRAQYCPFHEQLIASSSSDSLVHLYHTPQLCATQQQQQSQSQSGMGAGADGAAGVAAGADGAAGGKAGAPTGSLLAKGGDLDGKARAYDEHEDSVYGLAWSGADPWLFASLSHDGRMVVNKVPKNVKYKVIV